MTDAEQRFIAMCEFAEIGTGWTYWSKSTDLVTRFAISLQGSRPDDFPIVASTFDALTQERPELRPHYERAKAAWEASQ